MNSSVSQSQFFMWRTLFALAHADNIVTDEEVEFMAKALEGVDFTDSQTSILKDDIIEAKDVLAMFKNITLQQDRLQFFNFARELVWVDGDYGSEEQNVMMQLMAEQIEDVDVEELIGNVSMELEEPITQYNDDNNFTDEKGGFINMLTSFRKIFS